MLKGELKPEPLIVTPTQDRETFNGRVLFWGLPRVEFHASRERLTDLRSTLWRNIDPL